MKHWLLAALVLLGGAAASACADYVIIIANPEPLPEPPPNPMGGREGPMGPRGVPVPGGPGAAPPPMAEPPPPPALEPEVTLDPDARLPFATVIVEVNNFPNVLTALKLTWLSRNYNPLPITHRLSESGKVGEAKLLRKTKLCDAYVFPPPNYQHLESPSERYNAMVDEITRKVGGKEKPTAAEELRIAEYALKHGAVKKFVEIMDTFLVKDYPDDPNAKMYLKVKAELARTAKTPDAAALQASLPKGFKTATSDHYLVYYTSRNDEPLEVQHRVHRLENTFQAFYYWFGLKGLSIPVPTERQIAVVAFDEKEFDHYHKLLLPTPVVAGGFVSPREGVAVFSATRLDALYKSIAEYTKPFWTQGVDRTKVLEGNGDSGLTPQLAANKFSKAEIQTTALVLKGMENSVEQTGVTHNGTRQLLYASGLLNPNVVAPEWLQFGVSSFFETPLNSPNASLGMPSMDYLPLFRDLKKKGHLHSPAQVLRNVVTDHAFREAMMADDYNSLRHARALAWSLVYFLASDKDPRRVEGLRSYCRELTKMPRDMELDEETLLYAFCKAFKAFGLLDASGQIDAKSFDDFAAAWIKYIDEEHLELEELVAYARTAMAYKVKEIEKAKKDAENALANGAANPMGPQRTNPGAPNPNAGRGGNRAGMQQRPGYGSRYGP